MALPAETTRKPFEALTPDERSRLAGEILIGFHATRSFWWPKIVAGHACWDLVCGQFFSTEELAEFARQNKIPVQVPELIPKLQAMVGMQIMTRRDPVLVGQRAQDAPSAEDLNVVLKSIEAETALDAEETEAFKDGIVTSYPTFVWFEKSVGYAHRETIEIGHEAWDAVYPDEGFRRNDLKDCTKLYRIRQMSREEILDRYGRGARRPDIEAALAAEGTAGDDQGWSAEERSTLIRAFAEGSEGFRHNRHFVVEKLWFQREKVALYMSAASEQLERLPEDWDPRRIAAWEAENPGYQPLEVPDFKRLWVTAVTGSGALLDHGPHWYQEEEFPCEGFVADSFNNRPVGLVEFHRDNLRLGAHMETEQLHSIRHLTDGVVVLLEGAIANLEDVQYELSKPGGRVVVKRGHALGDAIQFATNRRENPAWREMKLQTLETLDRLSFDRNFEGGTQSSQESGRVVDMRIKQSQGKLLPTMSNLNRFVHRVRRKLLKILPYVLTEEQTFRWVKGGESREVTVNEPEYDTISGRVKRLINRLDAAKYDFVLDEADNSVSGLENEFQRFLAIMGQAMPNIPPQSWPPILASIPNRICQEMAKNLEEFAAAQKPPETLARLNVNLDGKDLPYNPLAQALVAKAGLSDAPPAGAPQSVSAPSPAAEPSPTQGPES